MKKKVTITYSWNNSDCSEIPTSHQESLEEIAMERVVEMMGQGYILGELHGNIRTVDEDDVIKYNGWWSISIKTI